MLVEELTWGEARLPPWARPGGYDWVLASDVCYDGDRFQPLIDTILQLVALDPATKVGILHMHQRSVALLHPSIAGISDFTAHDRT